MVLSSNSGSDTFENLMNRNFIPKNNSNAFAEQTMELSERMNQKKKKLKMILFVIIFIFSLPILFCDYYYWLNDKSCDKLSDSAIGIDDYLAVSSILSTFYLFLLFVMICFAEQFTIFFSNHQLISVVGAILIFISQIFNIVWNILGGIIFWSQTDISTCSNSKRDYVVVSLIIKYIFIFMGFFIEKKKE